MPINRNNFTLRTGFIIALVLSLGFVFTGSSFKANVDNNESAVAKPLSFKDSKLSLYDSLNLSNYGLSKEAFDYALTGFSKLMANGKIAKTNLISILDFSLPSSKKRLFIIDLVSGKLLMNTYASHGKNSGKLLPTEFSNKLHSNQSSLGFFITGDTYIGKHGESMRLEGKEIGINDKAMERGIVMHSAEYVGEHIVKAQGFLGRSQGCPALSPEDAKVAIKLIKKGTVFFIYSPNKHYASNSVLIRNDA